MAMTLLFREMFATTGQLTSGSPGANFSSVVGTLNEYASGPSVGAGAPASFDPQTSGQSTAYTSYGASTTTSGQNKLVIGAWFFLKSIGTSGTNASPVLAFRQNATSGNMPIALLATVGRIDTYAASGGGGTNLGSLPVTSGWVYLALAISKTSGTSYDGRAYYKIPGGALTQFVSWSAVNSFFSSWGSAVFGCVANNPNVNGRVGACSVYSFANADFSDVAYPSDLNDPSTGASTWYVNPSTGNDANDGITSGTPWRTVTKINTATANCGFFPAATYGAGDTLVVDTSGASLDLTPASLTIQTQGLNIRAANGQTWITCVPYKTLSAGGWSTTGTANVYSTPDTIALCTAWEDDKWLNHPTGANFAAVSASLGSTPGSFWTDGVTLYLHPFGNTDPRIDGKVYTRSHTGLTTGAIALNAANLNVQDLYVSKTCDVDPSLGLPNGGYAIGTGGLWAGTNLLKHCYTTYTGKHGFGLVANSASGETTTIDSCQAEQGSPYGSQTPFVSFNGASPTGIQHLYVNCLSIADTGVIGSTAGSSGAEVFYTHNNGGSDQFSLVSFEGCNFNRGYIAGTNAVTTLTVNNTTFGGDSSSGAKFKTFTRCRWIGPVLGGPLPNQNRSDGVLTVRNCLIVPTAGALLSNGTGNIIGTVIIEGNTFDLSNAVVQGGTSSALLIRTGAVTLTFRNNAVVANTAAILSIFKNFVNTDTLTVTNNQIVYNGSVWAKGYNDGATTVDRTFAQWQALGFDASSGNPASLNVNATSYQPNPGSPLLHVGVNIGPLTDYYGQSMFTVRDTVGAIQQATGNALLFSIP